MRLLALLLAVLLLAGCTHRNRRDETYLDALESLDLDPRSYPSIREYSDTIHGAVTSGLARFDDPAVLERLFWRCHEIADARVWPKDAPLQSIDPHWEARNAILYRLAEIPTDRAATVLVDLALHPDAHWDAGAALGAGDAVVRCGRRALPRLRERRADAPRAERMIRLIEAGATTYF